MPPTRRRPPPARSRRSEPATGTSGWRQQPVARQAVPQALFVPAAVPVAAQVSAAPDRAAVRAVPPAPARPGAAQHVAVERLPRATAEVPCAQQARPMAVQPEPVFQPQREAAAQQPPRMHGRTVCRTWHPVDAWHHRPDKHRRKPPPHRRAAPNPAARHNPRRTSPRRTRRVHTSDIPSTTPRQANHVAVKPLQTEASTTLKKEIYTPRGNPRKPLPP